MDIEQLSVNEFELTLKPVTTPHSRCTRLCAVLSLPLPRAPLHANAIPRRAGAALARAQAAFDAGLSALSLRLAAPPRHSLAILKF